MKNKFMAYTIFILALTLFIATRIYAGKSIDKAAKVSDSDSQEATIHEIPLIEETDKDATDSESEEQGLLNDEWHGEFTPVAKFSGELPRIVCWGDSLTASWDKKTAYPDRLREISGLEVINYGVEAETTSMIAMRQGGIPVLVGATVIPASTELIPVFLKTETGNAVFYLDHGDGGVNPCQIGGIEGNLSKLNGAYYFERSEEGVRTSLSEDSPFVTFGMADSNPNDVLVIFAGTNDLPDTESVYQLIDTIHDMLTVSKCDKYIIIGLTYAAGIPEIDKVNEILANEFEDNFLDIRNYLINYGLDDAGLKATANDLIDISEGEIPASLRRDYVHGNTYFYDLLAKQVYRRLQYLGYVPLGL